MTTPDFRFLADENCDFRVVRALRQAGHDVVAVGETTHRSVDKDLIIQAAREKRIFLTEDKDFGWLVFVSREDSSGVILIRFPGNAREELPSLITQLVAQQGEILYKSFVVVQPKQIRIRQTR